MDKKEDDNDELDIKKMRIKYTNGDLYEGGIKNDKKEGYGIMKYNNGITYK